MTPVLRRAGYADLPVLQGFVRAYYEFERLAHDPAAAERALGPLLTSDEAGGVWLIELDAEAIGYVALCFGYSIEFLGRDAFIDEFFIVEGQRGKGVGKAVLSQLQNLARGFAVKALHLEVGRDNEPAQRLYGAAGFQPRRQFMLMTKRL